MSEQQDNVQVWLVEQRPGFGNTEAPAPAFRYSDGEDMDGLDVLSEAEPMLVRGDRDRIAGVLCQHPAWSMRPAPDAVYYDEYGEKVYVYNGALVNAGAEDTLVALGNITGMHYAALVRAARSGRLRARRSEWTWLSSLAAIMDAWAEGALRKPKCRA